MTFIHRNRSLSIIGVLVLAVVAYAAPADASRGRNFSNNDDIVIVWDGTADVVPTQGYEGFTSTLAALNLLDYSHLAVTVAIVPLSTGPEPAARPRLERLVLLVHSNSLSAACQPGVSPLPLFCARVRRAEDVVPERSWQVLGLGVSDTVIARAKA